MTKKKMSSSAAPKKKAGATARASRRPAAAVKVRPKADKARPNAGKAQKPAKRTKASPAGSRAREPKARLSVAPQAAVRQRPAPPPPPPLHRSTYADAVAAYDKGMHAFHARRYADAQTILSSILSLYPEEKELHERVLLYLNVCARHVAPRAAAPETIEERVNTATLAINDGRPDEAIAILKVLAAEDPSNDSADYLLGVAYTLKRDFPAAMAHLDRAVRLNPENRDLIRKEADLEALRHTDEFESLLSTGAGRRRKT